MLFLFCGDKMILEALILALISMFFIREKDLNNLINFKFKRFYLAFIGIFIMVFINFITGRDFGSLTDFFVKNFTLFHIASLLLISLSFFSNYENKGLLICGIGTFLNALPVMVNGKMPVSPSALMKTENERIIKIIYMGGSLSHGVFDKARLYFLSDFIYLKRFIGPSKVISLGDILIALGLYIALIIIVRKRGA